MPLSDVTNAELDTRLGAVAAPYGPLTRTGTATNLDTNPALSPNSDVEYHVKSAAGFDVYISYDQLADVSVYTDIIKDFHGANAVLQTLKEWSAQLNAVINGTNFDALTAPEHYLQILMKMFQALPLLGFLVPFEAFAEVQDDTDTLVASFSVVDASDVATLTQNSTGLWHFGLVDWGDGHIELIPGPGEPYSLVHDYNPEAPDTYTIRMVLIGPQGIVFDTDTIVVT